MSVAERGAEVGFAAMKYAICAVPVALAIPKLTDDASDVIAYAQLASFVVTVINPPLGLAPPVNADGLNAYVHESPARAY